MKCLSDGEQLIRVSHVDLVDRTVGCSYSIRFHAARMFDEGPKIVNYFLCLLFGATDVSARMPDDAGRSGDKELRPAL